MLNVAQIRRISKFRSLQLARSREKSRSFARSLARSRFRSTVYTIAEDFILTLVSFYRAMHFSAKRGIAITCRLSVCL